MSWLSHPEPEEGSPPLLSDRDKHEELSLAAVKSTILQDLIDNTNRPLESRHYTTEFATFSFIAEIDSSQCYGFLRTLFDVPSQQTLQTRFGHQVEEMEQTLTAINEIPREYWTIGRSTAYFQNVCLALSVSMLSR
jgi:hypothetical protein